MLQEFKEKLGMAAATPEADHLFMVRDEGETHYIPEEQANNFHHTVVQLLFMSARERLDIQTAV